MSNPAVASATSPAGCRIGCDVGPRSIAYAACLDRARKPAHASVNAVASVAAQKQAQLANASLSHRSSHQRMVTMSPNHMCAISCSRITARSSRSAGDGSLR